MLFCIFRQGIAIEFNHTKKKGGDADALGKSETGRIQHQVH